MKNLKSFNIFEINYFDLSKRDKLKFDVIFDKLYDYENEKKRMISDLKQILKDYELSLTDDLKEYFKEELEYLESSLKSYKKMKKK